MEISDEQKISYIIGKLQVRPSVSKNSLKNLLLQCYGLDLDENVEPKELVSYDDRNFLIKGLLFACLFLVSAVDQYIFFMS